MSSAPDDEQEEYESLTKDPDLGDVLELAFVVGFVILLSYVVSAYEWVERHWDSEVMVDD